MIEQHSYSGDYTNSYKFNGKELDEETGFYYYGARYYNPKFSIWLSVDPLAEKFPSWSPYNYTMNNPINLIDPDGRAVAAPPRNGIAQFIDNSGIYFWNIEKKSYEHYKYTDSSRKNYSFSEYYKVTSSSKVVGQATVIQNVQGEHTVTEPSLTEKIGTALKSIDKSMQAKNPHQYEGLDGMMEFADDLGKASTYVKGAGAILVVAGTVTAQPEVVAGGVSVYDMGGNMDKISTGLSIIGNSSKGDYNQVAKDVRSEIINYGIGKAVDVKIPKSDKASNAMFKYGIESTVNKIKENQKKGHNN